MKAATQVAETLFNSIRRFFQGPAELVGEPVGEVELRANRHLAASLLLETVGERLHEVKRQIN